MTGKQIFTKAMKLLGYTNDLGLSNESDLIQRENAVVNAVYSDLFYACGKTELTPLESMDTEIDLPEKVLNDCFVYGVAMMIAQSESEGDNQQLYANLYNQKRSACTYTEEITDVLPKGV